MCNNCCNCEYVCDLCGAILDDEYSHLIGYYADRRTLKRLAETSTEELFVWFMRYSGKIVKIGCGGLMKLYNETKPNATYIKFDSVFIYYCNNVTERNIFATVSMSRIDGVVNKRAMANDRYIGKTDLHFRNNVPPYIRGMVLESPDLIIGNNIYWDKYKLQEEVYEQQESTSILWQ